MKLEFWLDYLSPLSYQTHKLMEIVIEQNPGFELEVLYRSYEMMPGFRFDESCTLYDVVAKHHVLTADETVDLLKGVEDVAHVRPVSVIDAHRLSHLAKQYNLAYAFNRQLFKAYYEEQKDISNHHVLIDIATVVGIDPACAEWVLASDQFRDAVSLNRENAIIKGIHQIPHLRLDGKIRLNGLQSVETLISAINRARIQIKDDEHCKDEHCARKKTH
ncbi:MAG: hypothetical protein EA375_01070 [Acholeplasmataceae bacterium]|nr:MAG: hypothetical protein EA375_01070 [Acholeplasmataceae bacterium]